MSSVIRVADDRPASPVQLDPESAGWLGALADAATGLRDHGTYGFAAASATGRAAARRAFS